MKVPILRQGACLIASVQDALSDAELHDLQARLAEKVGETGVGGVVIDVTVLDVIDSFATRTLSTITSTVRVRGAETVVVGIQPEVAFAMVQLGLSLDGVSTALDLDEGLAQLRGRGVADAAW
ncbi:MAG: STAS domain-containing protein [Actinobacteria bacterium]|nr:STAS domain-containing protein [Actinomycetota bacterium]MBW3648980.1 STAS domain-containing protein [Actinomycetota bacterium]